jgi:hypothetical protein
MAVRLVDGIMKPRPKKHQQSTIHIIEEAVHLLRAAPGSLLAGYYLGSAPFILGLMYFWADMSRNAKAGEYSAIAALGLAFLYIWMKFWHTFFAYRLRAQIAGETHCRWRMRRIVSVVATQALIQSTRIIVLPIAGVLLLPFGFCYAFYQNATVHAEEEIQTVTATSKWALRQARLWPRQNHMLIAISWIFGIVILLNLSITVFLIPQMAKTLFGIDSIFNLSGIRMILNTTFWIAMLGMTFLCLDPFIKTVYVLRCFYGTTLKSGEDLKRELVRITAGAKMTVMGLTIMILCATPLTCLAGQPTLISSGELDRSIEETLGRREFTWRMPRDTVQERENEAKGPLAAAINWLMDVFAKGIRVLGTWINQLFEWLENLLPQPEKKQVSTNRSWITPIRAVIFLFLLLGLIILTYMGFRIRRRHRTVTIAGAVVDTAPLPDLNDEGTKADDLPISRWLKLAEKLTAKGELRLAMRALYLATLAHLAEQELITIEIYKSNREYEEELKRRAHEYEKMRILFSENLNLFERVWYGMYRIPHTVFNDFATNQKRILTLAQY